MNGQKKLTTFLVNVVKNESELVLKWLNVRFFVEIEFFFFFFAHKHTLTFFTFLYKFYFLPLKTVVFFTAKCDLITSKLLFLSLI